MSIVGECGSDTSALAVCRVFWDGANVHVVPIGDSVAVFCTSGSDLSAFVRKYFGERVFNTSQVSCGGELTLDQHLVQNGLHTPQAILEEILAAWRSRS